LRAFALLIERGGGFGFQESKFTYDMPVALMVLPCAWFDATWIDQPTFGREQFNRFFRSWNPAKWRTEDNSGNMPVDIAPCPRGASEFFPGAFAHHWHNQWQDREKNDSVFGVLEREVDSALGRLALTSRLFW